MSILRRGWGKRWVGALGGLLALALGACQPAPLPPAVVTLAVNLPSATVTAARPTATAAPSTARPKPSATPSPQPAPSDGPQTPTPSTGSTSTGSTSTGRPTPPPLALQVLKVPGPYYETLFSIPLGLQGVHYSPSPKMGPQALAAAPDGSFWIVDSVARQALHYSPLGQFLESLDLSAQAERLVDAAASDAGLYLLDLGSSPRLFFFPPGAAAPQEWPLPGSIGPERGLNGIDLDPAGRLIFELNAGTRLVWEGPGSPDPLPLEGLSLDGTLYRVDFPALMVGETTVPLTFTTGLGSLSVLTVFPQGGFLALQEDVLSLDSPQVDLRLHYFDRLAAPLGMARVPLREQYLPVAHPLAVGPDGRVYWMQTRLDAVRINRLNFYPTLPPP